jgi:hypothetical protein
LDVIALALDLLGSGNPAGLFRAALCASGASILAAFALVTIPGGTKSRGAWKALFVLSGLAAGMAVLACGADRAGGSLLTPRAWVVVAAGVSATCFSLGVAQRLQRAGLGRSGG